MRREKIAVVKGGVVKVGKVGGDKLVRPPEYIRLPDLHVDSTGVPHTVVSRTSRMAGFNDTAHTLMGTEAWNLANCMGVDYLSIR